MRVLEVSVVQWRRALWLLLSCGSIATAALSSVTPAAHAGDEGPAAAQSSADPGVSEPAKTEKMSLEQFLDRLMMAESGGHAFAKNPRSTAVGPFQFIASTWLQVTRQFFADETAKLKPHEILDLRTEPAFARRAAKAYTEQNAAYLVAQGADATFANLRLAFLVGPGGAARVLAAKPNARISTLLGATVIGANPFMTRITAQDLILRAGRDISDDAALAGLDPDALAVAIAGARQAKTAPALDVACNLSLPSCRRWLALATRKLSRIKRASRD